MYCEETITNLKQVLKIQKRHTNTHSATSLMNPVILSNNGFLELKVYKVTYSLF